MKIAVYTFITKDYDTIRNYNRDFQKEADFFVFTDNSNNENN